ncbi:MAG: hypothetical protein HKN16_00640, partial [Saprospiraceae bacterium]|nr:hypothetical protein [Saprospiraceae bacterium]
MAKKKKKQQAQRKKNWMVGILVLAMIAFVASQIPWNRFSGPKASSTPSSTSTGSTSKTSSSSATKFVEEGTLTIRDNEGQNIATVSIEVSDSD